MSEKVFDFLQEFVEDWSFVFGDTGLSERNKAFKGLFIEVTVERLANVALNDGLHLSDSIIDPICLSICNHLLEVIDWVYASYLLYRIIFIISFAFFDSSCLRFSQLLNVDRLLFLNVFFIDFCLPRFSFFSFNNVTPIDSLLFLSSFFVIFVMNDWECIFKVLNFLLSFL